MKLLPYILAGSAKKGGSKSDYMFVFDIANPMLYLEAFSDVTSHAVFEYIRGGVKTTETYNLLPNPEGPLSIMVLADANTPIRVNFDADVYACTTVENPDLQPGYISHLISFTCTPHEGSDAFILFAGSYPEEGVIRPKVSVSGKISQMNFLGSTPEILDLSKTTGEPVEGMRQTVCSAVFASVNAKKIILSKEARFNIPAIISNTLEEIEAAAPFEIPVEESSIGLQAASLNKVRSTYIPDPNDEVDLYNFYEGIAAIAVGVERGVVPDSGTFYFNKDIADFLKPALESEISQKAPGWTIVYE